MEAELAGCRALVTGSSSGIGAGIARYLASAGVSVAVHGRNAGPAHEVERQIKDACGNAIVVTGDISTDTGAQDVYDSVMDAFGGLDILVNNVGGTGGTITWDTTTMDQWLEQYQLNTLTAVRMIRHFMPGMREQAFGRIIQIASIAGVRPFPDQVPAYCAAKAALIVTNVSLAQTLAGTGVTANCITPGFVATQLLQDYVLASPGNEGKIWEEIEPAVAEGFRCKVGRLGKPDDIASLVAYLARRSSSWITGSNFRIDGGTADWVN